MPLYCERHGCNDHLEALGAEHGHDFAVPGVTVTDAMPGTRGLNPVVAESCAKRDHVAAAGMTRGPPEFGLEITPSEYPLSTHSELP